MCRLLIQFQTQDFISLKIINKIDLIEIETCLQVHTLLPKLQTKKGNKFKYVKNVIFTERIQPGVITGEKKKHTVLLLVLGRHTVLYQSVNNIT